jgi:peptidoglycan/LPS O-acetylase OafA/YrhL
MHQIHRLRNFDTIRLVAAGSVIFSHAFLIADGHDKNEPFVRATGYILGIYGVCVFLIISGYLVTHSLRTSSSLRSFAWKRFLRIYPALFACAVFGAFIVAPFFSELAPRDYLLSSPGVKSVAKIMLLYDVQDIKSVQFYQEGPDWLRSMINGSLWTIASEIYCYMLLFVFAALDLVVLPVAIFGLLAGTALFTFNLSGWLPLSSVCENLLYTVPSFCAGVAMYLVHERFKLSRNIAVVFAIFLLLAAPTGWLLVLFPILAAYPIVYFGLSDKPWMKDATKFGDLSYGTYLYGWPIEQVVRGVIGPSLSGWTLCLISLPIAVACGWTSWHLIEKHALSFKGLVSKQAALPNPQPIDTIPSSSEFNIQHGRLD